MPENDQARNSVGRQYVLEDVFSGFGEYQRYLTKALALFREQKKRRNTSLQKYVPEYLEIHFSKTIKAPRLYFPRYTGVVIVELPDSSLSPKQKAVIRERALGRYAGIVKVNELACADEFAMRMKIMENDKDPKRSKRSVGIGTGT